MEPDPDSEDHHPFELARQQARRARWAMNFLVFLSAGAGAAFFGYVLYTVRPFSPRTPEPVTIPTSKADPVQITLRGESNGLRVVLSDLDEAAEYAAALSGTIRASLGISEDGILMRISIRNHGQDSQSVALQSLTLIAADGRQRTARWLSEVADVVGASPAGRIRLQQSAQSFELPAGSERQLQFFVPGEALRVSNLHGARLNAGIAEIELARNEAGVGQ